MRKSLVVLGILLLILPLLFVGCSGDDGATGAAGPPGDAGAPGPPGTGVLANESCVVCHAEGRVADVAASHDPATGTVTAEITGAAFNEAKDNVSVTFTFAVTDASGNPVDVNLAEAATGSTNLRYLRFTIARLVPGQVYDISTRDPDAWFYYGARSHRRAANLQDNGGGSYTFTFTDDSVLDPAEAGFTHRVGFELNIAEFPPALALRSVNPTFDWVPDGGTITTRDIVTTAACNECHNPLGYTPSFHGSRRVDTKYCVLCHNPNNDLAPQSADAGAPSVPIPFVKAIHGVHNGKDLLVFEDGVNHGDFTEVTYPQDLRNCNKCHKGTEGQNWNTLPSREACGTCHDEVDFDTGAGHTGGAQANNRLCAVCHTPSEIGRYHLTTVATPNSANVPANLVNFEYVIDAVTVNADNAAVVTFHINKDGTPLDLSTYPPTGFTGGPAFLLAYALPQDGIASPADYNNLGRSAGQPASISLANVAGSLAGSPAAYTVTLSSAPFPAGAMLRAVAIQGTFTQTGVDLDGDPSTAAVNVSRPTPSVVKAVTGEERRTVVKSGYVDDTGEPVTNPANFSTATPIGCLECHETLALHGGSRVNNVQVCVICHNPNLSSSGRAIDPATQTISPDVVAAVGSDPLVYPEASMHFKNLIHGIHRASDRPYEFVRNRTSGGLTGFYYNWSEVTFPGNLMACTKCHIGSTYRPDELPAGVLVSTERTTTGDTAEIQSDIAAARDSVPNDTDLVNTPIASACYYCHDTVIAKAHMESNGGKIGSEREDAILALTP